MRIVNELTDTRAGMLALEDDQGKPKRYVRRKRRVGLTHIVDLVKTGIGPLQFVTGHRLDGRNLPEQVVVCERSEPLDQAPSAYNMGESEYQADERAFWIWEKFRDMTMRERRTLNALEVKRILDIADPEKAIGNPWNVKEVEREMVKWAQDKGEASAEINWETNMPNTRNVFVIHGRNRPARDAMFDFLRAAGLNPLEWGQAVKMTGKGSPYIGEVLDAAFSNAQAVVVVLTGDDLARLRDDFLETHDPDYERNLSQQARPNVLFEAGMAFGRHSDRTIMVQIGHLRPFSDVAGKHAIHFTGTAEQRTDLRERLKTAGCAVTEGGTDWLKAGNFDEAARLTTLSDHKTAEKTPITPNLNDNDIMSLLETWWKRREEHQHIEVIKTDEVDEHLSLPKGSAMRLLEKVATNLGYKLQRRGERTLLFKEK
jgi:predicted nucleotide-binding protein